MADNLCGLEEDFRSIWKEADQLVLSGDLEKAKTLYTQFIEQRHDITKDGMNIAIAKNNRGHVKYLQVDFDAAIKDYNEALKIKPNLAVSYYNRGTIHYRMGRFMMAIEDFKKAVELDPEFKDAYESLEQAKYDFISVTAR